MDSYLLIILLLAAYFKINWTVKCGVNILWCYSRGRLTFIYQGGRIVAELK